MGSERTSTVTNATGTLSLPRNFGGAGSMAPIARDLGCIVGFKLKSRRAVGDGHVISPHRRRLGPDNNAA